MAQPQNGMAAGKSVSSDQWKKMRLVAGMAPEAGRDLLEAVEALRRKEGFPLVIVEHRLRQVQPHVNRVLVMREGLIVDDTRETERMLDADWLARHYVNGGGA